MAGPIFYFTYLWFNLNSKVGEKQTNNNKLILWFCDKSLKINIDGCTDPIQVCVQDVVFYGNEYLFANCSNAAT